MADKINIWKIIAVFLFPALFVCQIFFLFPITVDDGFIVLRYAGNLVLHNQLVFNLGEYVSALTSPLHALIQSLIFKIFNDAEIVGKFVSLAVMLSITVISLWKYRRNLLVPILFSSLVLLSPYLNFWTVAGLETPYVAFVAFLITLQFIAFIKQPGGRETFLIPILSGILFMLRYDTALFTAPIVLFVLLNVPLRAAVTAILISAVIPFSWLGFAYGYYGEIFPTSFFSKPPALAILKFGQNVIYIIEFAVFSMLFFTIAVIAVGRKNRQVELWNHVKRYRYLYAGFALIIAYATTMATHHMMFSYRIFVGYLPAVALIISEFIFESENDGKNWTRRLAFLVPIIVVMQMSNFAVLKYQSIGGSRVSEYGLTNVNNYLDFIQMMRNASVSIKRHWSSQPASNLRKVNIDAGAEGVIPYTFMDSNAYGPLVGYRHSCSFDQASADYIFLRLRPYPSRSPDLKGLIDRRLEQEQILLKYEVIFKQVTKFESIEQSWVVLWNKSPKPNLISKSVNINCGAPRTANP